MEFENESQLIKEAHLSLEKSRRLTEFIVWISFAIYLATVLVFYVKSNWGGQVTLIDWLLDNKFYLMFIFIASSGVIYTVRLLLGRIFQHKYRRLLEDIMRAEAKLDKGNESERRAHREREEEKKAEREFKTNLKSEIILESFALQSIDFYHPIKWDLQPQVNVLLGKNGYGKSHLLRGLAALAQADEGVCGDFFTHANDDVLATLGLTREGERKKVVRQRLFFDASISKVPLLAIPDTRFLNKSRSAIGSGSDDKVDPARFGAFLMRGSSRISSIRCAWTSSASGGGSSWRYFNSSAKWFVS